MLPLEEVEEDDEQLMPPISPVPKILALVTF
jgi:hypothetical protein